MYGSLKSQVSGEEEEDADVEEKSRLGGWREKVIKAVHSEAVELALAVLLIIDVICLVVELLLDAKFPPCAVILDRCVASSLTPSLTSCLEHDQWLEQTHFALYWISVFILSVFAFEMGLLMLAWGLKFFSQPLYVLDALIVGVSLVLELGLRDRVSKDAGGFLIFIRLWRLVRIGHGVFTDTREYEQHVIASLHARIEQLEHELALTQSKTPTFL